LLTCPGQRGILKMLIRIVRMTFREAELGAFLTLFEAVKHRIRSFPGCQRLDLLRDLDQPNVYVTYSHWTSPDALENYRQSDLFKKTWAATKILFAEKASAFSMESLENVEAPE